LLTVKLNKLTKTIFIFLAILLFSACEKKKSVGEENVILVVADEQVFNRYKTELENAFNRPIYTPITENHYNLLRISLQDFIPKNIYKNVIFLTDIDQVSPESNYINEMLSDEIKDGIRKGDYYFVFKTDMWAKNQNVLILMDSKEAHLSTYLDQFKDKLYHTINERNLEIIKNRMDEKKYDTETAEKLKQKYGVSVTIPDGFQLVDEGKNIDFFQLRRQYPADRWLTVIKGSYDANFTMQENIIKLRDSASREFGDSIRINPEIITFDNDTTFDANGVITKGIWEWNEGGGPFINYAFIKNNQLYMIDCAVYAPGMDKYQHLDQLQVMARMVKVK